MKRRKNPRTALWREIVQNAWNTIFKVTLLEMFDTKNCLAFATATLLEMFDTKNCLAFEAYED